jgi:hypothetical protein
MTDASKGMYTFFSYVRRGAAAAITDPDSSSKATPGRASYNLSLTVGGLASSPQTKATLYGPGDVTGIDPGLIGLMQPAPHTTDFEPNYFPAVELTSADFPWMFTPASANTSGQLRPWLCLVAIEKIDGVLDTSPANPLPQVAVKDAALELPDPADTFAWAHVQVTGSLAGTTLEAVLDSNPERVVSRLLCPRNLESGTTYLACVVPVFKAGAQAGMGEEVKPGDLAYAWTPTDKNFRLPVYHHWEFTTGPAGDFEGLVRLLEPRPVPSQVGTRPLDVSDPGGGMPAPAAASPAHLGLEGALRAPGAAPTPWPQGKQTGFESALRKLLDAPGKRAAADPSVPLSPPLYGRWHAARDTVPKDSGKFTLPHWLRELNLDPRNRVAAALGTAVVQERQEELMERAWKQVGEIERANQALRQAQMARSAGVSMHERHFIPLGAAQLLQLTEPVHARVTAGGVTVRAEVKASCLPAAALSPGFRRLLRPRGPVARRWARRSAARVEGRHRAPLLERLASGSLHAVSERGTPDGTVTGEVVSQAAVASRRPGDAAKLALTELTEAATLAAPTQDFEVLTGEDRERPQPRSGSDSAEAAAFRAAAAAHQAEVLEQAPAQMGCKPLGLPSSRNGLLGALDPRVTVPARTTPRVRVPQGTWSQADPLEPVMVAPEFPEPMYGALRDLSQEWLLPGLEHVPANTLTVLESNTRFIESYMVGLNHEMGRELLWREYPTDQRGTCFRQFWDLSAVVPQPTTDAAREELKDVDEIHRWPAAKHLGDTRARGASRKARLVLLVRGELLKRYPGAVIYAVAALKGTGGKRKPSTAANSERYPVFRGTLSPDVTFLAFDLTAAEARGGGTKQGWFFVIQQQPTEPRFGLDESVEWQAGQPGGWEDLSWGHLVGVDKFPPAHAPVAGSRPASWSGFTPAGVKWSASAQSAHIAYISLQRPVRVAIHADDMLPPP